MSVNLEWDALKRPKPNALRASCIVEEIMNDPPDDTSKFVTFHQNEMNRLMRLHPHF